MGIVAEEWRSVEGYEGAYEVSNFGRVRSLTRMVASKAGSRRLLRGRVLRLGVDSNGYLHFSARLDGTCRTVKVHQLVARTFVAGASDGKQVNHKDGVKANNASSNLEWVSASENILHAVRTGLRVAVCGEQQPAAKLSEAQVLEIRRIAREGQYSQKKIARMFGVCQMTISHIVSRSTWKHVA